MAGVQTDLGRMKVTAADAARIGDELKSAVAQLDAKLVELGAMEGLIKNAFWQGHRNHLEAVERLCVKLHRMSEGITSGQNLYGSGDGESQATFSQLGNAIDVGKLV